MFLPLFLCQCVSPCLIQLDMDLTLDPLLTSGADPMIDLFNVLHVTGFNCECECQVAPFLTAQIAICTFSTCHFQKRHRCDPNLCWLRRRSRSVCILNESEIKSCCSYTSEESHKIAHRSRGSTADSWCSTSCCEGSLPFL